MHNLANIYVLMIEPDIEGKKSKKPIEDNLTMVVDKLMAMCVFKDIRYRGTHRTNCGEKSDNKDWILPGGQITNSLAPYYIRYYRPYIPECEIIKIKKLSEEYLNIKL